MLFDASLGLQRSEQRSLRNALLNFPQPVIKASQIACQLLPEACGLGSSQYFATVFLPFNDCTPVEFQEQSQRVHSASSRGDFPVYRL